MSYQYEEPVGSFRYTESGTPIYNYELLLEDSSKSNAMAENSKSSNFWIITFEHFKKDVKKPEDNLVIFVHWLLVKNNFLVLEQDNEDKNNIEKLTEILPTNWTEKEMYKMYYKRDGDLFLLSGVKACDSFIFNLYNVSTKHVASAAIACVNSAVEWITDSANNKDKFYEIIHLLEADLIIPLQKEDENKKNIKTQPINMDPIPIDQLRRRRPDFQPEPLDPINPFPSYGMPDLNPLGGGGMLFDPLMQRRRPNNGPGIPPMARFDPTRPINPDPGMPGSLSRPRPDHMRPPDFDDSLYM